MFRNHVIEPPLNRFQWMFIDFNLMIYTDFQWISNHLMIVNGFPMFFDDI